MVEDNMKRYLTIFCLLFILCPMLCSCNSTDKKQEILKHEWKIEFISDLDGNILKTTLEQSDRTDKKYDMVLAFGEDNYFSLSDKTNNKKWQGNYMIEKVNSSYKIDLYCEDSETVITGVYGIRKYDDKTEIPSIILQTEDKILSFIVNE